MFSCTQHKVRSTLYSIVVVEAATTRKLDYYYYYLAILILYPVADRYWCIQYLQYKAFFLPLAGMCMIIIAIRHFAGTTSVALLYLCTLKQ